MGVVSVGDTTSLALGALPGVPPALLPGLPPLLPGLGIYAVQLRLLRFFCVGIVGHVEEVERKKEYK